MAPTGGIPGVGERGVGERRELVDMLTEAEHVQPGARWLPWLIGRSASWRARGEAGIDDAMCDVAGRDMPVRGVDGTELP